MNESELKTAIGLGIADYKIWTIGITEDPKRRKAEHEAEGKDVTYWPAGKLILKP